MRRRHCATATRSHYRDLARRLFEEADGPQQIAVLHRLAAEDENLLTAMAHAVDRSDVDVALRLLTSFWGHAGLILYLPPFSFDALELEGATEHPLYPSGLVTAAYVAANRGEIRVTDELCVAALAAVDRLGNGDPFLEGMIWSCRGMAAATVGAFADGAAHYERAAQICRSAGLSGAQAISLGAAATGHNLAGALERALPLATEGLALARQLGTPECIAINLTALAGALTHRDPEQASALFARVCACSPRLAT